MLAHFLVALVHVPSDMYVAVNRLGFHCVVIVAEILIFLLENSCALGCNSLFRGQQKPKSKSDV